MRIIILGFLFLFSLSIFAQKSYEFSTYVEKYPFELQEFMSANADKDKKKEIEEFILGFDQFWQSDSLSKNEKMEVIKMSNLMSANRFHAFPAFDNFSKSILAISRDDDNEENFSDWINSLEYYVKRKRIAYLHQYLEYSLQFFTSHIIYDKSNKIWKLSHGKMKIEEETNNPVFIFGTVDLTGYSDKDSSYILRTSGKLHPIKKRWEGQGGKMFWTRLGIDTNTIFAQLSYYKIDLSTNLWRADSVIFYDRRKFDFPLEGKIRDKYGYSEPNEASTFPSFTSYRHDLVMKDVFPDIDYQGGYTLTGLRVIGSGEGSENAYFIFKHNGTKFVWAGSQTFVIEDDKILSEKVEVTIYLESVDTLTGETSIDSIYHPGLSMYYSNAKKHLSIYRKEEGLSKTPFFDSYHRIDLYVEELNWKIGEDFIDMKSIQQKGIESRAYFESVNLFSRARYEKLQGLDRSNPVYEVFRFTEKIGFNEFYAEDFAQFLNMDKSSTIAYLMNLASKGFLLYDTDENYVIVKENVRTYVLAYKGDSDYDVIGFSSSTNGQIPNASLDLRNNDIVLQGVNIVHLSDSQDVKIFPNHGRIELKKNRDFVFDGKIMAGLFDLYAHKCYFSYDKFELELSSIDSLSFSVQAFEENEYGEKPLVRVKTVIEDLKGNILIDHPNNKSGRENFPEYPILNSKSRSYVYYEKASIFNKVYSRDKFFYRLESFTIDSLDDFKTEGLEFEGYLASAGIFADIEEPLKVQKDYSLGLTTTTGPGGYGIYGGKGRYNDTIQLSNAGLRGSGNLQFLTSTSYSDDFIFLPDSTNAYLTSYVIAEKKSGVEYPGVSGNNVKMHWEPYHDLMEVNTTKGKEPFEMYDKEANMTGLLSLSSKELQGDGEIVIKNAEMDSHKFKFKNRTYDTDSCMFRLRTFMDSDIDEMASLEETKQYAYQTEDNFKASVNFDERQAVFESTTGSKPVNFEENMYKCYMDMFTWYMDEDKTEFSSKDDPMAQVEGKGIRQQVDLDLNGTEFVSTHPGQDSLRFKSANAVYLQRQKLIHAYGVPLLIVADAAIIPGTHEILIRAKAEMDEITDAEILVNRETKNHTLYNGTLKVKGLHDYSGRALYDYIDEDGNIQNIYFSNIDVDTAGFTIAKAVIEPSASFSLSRYFNFSGAVDLVGVQKYLTFTGGTGINHQCDTLDHPQFIFSAQIDPVNIKIPVGEDLRDNDGHSLFSGLKAKETNGKVYSSFLTGDGRPGDHIVMQSFGFLMFDKISQEYRIASEDKLSQRSLPGNYLSLSKRECNVYAEGKMDLAFNTGHVEAEAYGIGRYFTKEDSTVLNVSIPLNFFFNEKALEIMVAELNFKMDLDAVDLESDIYKIMLYNMLGFEKGDEILGKIMTNGGAHRKLPKELIKTIFISDVKMKYNPRTRSFVSTGPIGIASVGKEQVMKYVEGKLEIQNKMGTYEITLALDLGNKMYYYFEFKGNDNSGTVFTYSSNEEYNTIIKETKPDDRKAKTSGKEPKFNYYMSTPTAFKKFLRTMEIKE